MKMPRLKKVLTVTRMKDADEEDRQYWAKQTPLARLRALELMRWMNYGPAVFGRLQRVLEIVHPKKG